MHGDDGMSITEKARFADTMKLGKFGRKRRKSGGFQSADMKKAPKNGASGMHNFIVHGVGKNSMRARFEKDEPYDTRRPSSL